jgi:hypothetical protein
VSGAPLQQTPINKAIGLMLLGDGVHNVALTKKRKESSEQFSATQVAKLNNNKQRRRRL